MLLVPDLVDPLDRLAQRIRLAAGPERDLVFKILSNGCVRVHALKATTAARRLTSLLDAGAWTEAAMALVELEMPAACNFAVATTGGERDVSSLCLETTHARRFFRRGPSPPMNRRSGGASGLG